jgi:serine/threonine protein phosphatase 1
MRIKLNPVNIGNLWNLDTGAAYDGKITIMNIDTKEFEQSDPLYRLYPDEKGRNRYHLMFERGEK